MPFELRPLAQEDAQEAAALLVASFKNNPFRGIALPNGMSQDTIDEIVAARQKAVDDPAMYALKVVDTDNNDKMAGCAVWNHVKAMTDEGWERAKEEALKEYPEARHDMLDEFTAKGEEFKRRIMGHTRWLNLDVLNTLPEYQRRGVGSMLMRWGIDKLEEMKVPGFIVSTDVGYDLYSKYGFRVIERWEANLSRWPPAQGIYRNYFMTRMPSSFASSSS